MDFVKNEKTKAIAVAVHVHIRTVVGRYSEVFKLVIPPAQDADIAGKGVFEQVIPLIHKINRRRDNKSTAANFRNTHQRQKRLARPCGQNNHAAILI